MVMRNWRLGLAACAVFVAGALVLSDTAKAAVVWTTRPADARVGKAESADIQIWLESTGRTAAAYATDHNGSDVALVDGPGDATPGSVAAGTLYRSYMVHYDPVLSGLQTNSGSVTFATRIIGIMFTPPPAGTNNLGNSDALGGGTLFPPASNNNRGLELGTSANSDRFSISGGGKTLTLINLGVNGNLDQMRVLTATPEPMSLALWSVTGLVGAVVARRRLKK